jgi:ubiquinone/menaquinone biosynthesis C-methylase UbiE
MNSSVKNVLRQVSPPFVLEALRKIRRNAGPGSAAAKATPDQQDLDIYWTDEMAAALETWGDGNVWHEIRYLLANCRGRVLDIACGTGKTMMLNSENPNLELHGCDISDLLIQKAVDRGIDAARVKIADATQMDYADDSFDYSYSIGSLEHFTEDGIGKFISECHRVTRLGSFHMIPVSRSGTDEGWMKTEQSFFNNSSQWWLGKFRQHYDTVVELESLWNDPQSNGRWFICLRS